MSATLVASPLAELSCPRALAPPHSRNVKTTGTLTDNGALLGTQCEGPAAPHHCVNRGKSWDLGDGDRQEGASRVGPQLPGTPTNPGLRASWGECHRR